MSAMTYPTDELLIEGCLIPQNEAWFCFYARFGGLIRGTVRRALGRCAADGNVVDELVQNALLKIYKARIAFERFRQPPRVAGGIHPGIRPAMRARLLREPDAAAQARSPGHRLPD